MQKTKESVIKMEISLMETDEADSLAYTEKDCFCTLCLFLSAFINDWIQV